MEVKDLRNLVFEYKNGGKKYWRKKLNKSLDLIKYVNDTYKVDFWREKCYYSKIYGRKIDMIKRLVNSMEYIGDKNEEYKLNKDYCMKELIQITHNFYSKLYGCKNYDDINKVLNDDYYRPYYELLPINNVSTLPALMLFLFFVINLSSCRFFMNIISLKI